MSGKHSSSAFRRYLIRLQPTSLQVMLTKRHVQSGLINPNPNEPPFELRIIAGSDKQIVSRKGFNFINSCMLQAERQKEGQEPE
jgi:hypothetical protein